MTPSDHSSSSLINVALTPRDNYRVSPPSDQTLKIAHISDTHLGLKERTVYVSNRPESTEPVTKQVSSFEKFRGLLTTLQTLDPDIILHTGDIANEQLWDDRSRYEEFKSSIPTFSNQGLLFYVRGNHDRFLTRTDLSELFGGFDVLPLEDSGPIPIADGQILLCGLDHRNSLTNESALNEVPQNSDESIIIGAFHQSIKGFSRSYDANVDLNDLAPSSEDVGTFYDLLLFGHMHTNTIQQIRECLLIDGGSTLGLNTPSTVGMLTFSEAGSHYQRFPLWME